MKKYILKSALISILLAITLSSNAFCAESKKTQVESIDPKNGVFNLNLDKENAVKIAEIVLCHIYGKQVLKERPWNVKELEKSFLISGTLPPNVPAAWRLLRFQKLTAKLFALYTESKRQDL